KALRVRIQKASAIDYLRNERRLLGAASVGPIDMGTQVMSVARVGPPHLRGHRNFANLLRSHRHARASRSPQRAEDRHTDTRFQTAKPRPGPSVLALGPGSGLKGEGH